MVGPSRGCLALVLHAHLPYVRHPEHASFLEEDWLYEAITETYLPLVQALESLAEDRVPFGLTLSVSPTLVSMLRDPLLQERYSGYLERLQRLAHGELQRNQAHGHLHYLAGHYRDRFASIAATWERHHGDLVGALGALEQQGCLDLMTCAATHGYLPLLQVTPQAVRAQIAVAVAHHTKHFGRAPRGIWLPECGYYPGLDAVLAEFGIRYFVADTHALLLARPRPRMQSFAPIFCPGSGVAVFGRDMESSVQVWSRQRGYPGDHCYREFYRDIGFDLELDYIGPYIQPGGRRKNTGIKYHRITGTTDHKELYDPYWARRRAHEHAHDFIAKRNQQLEQLEQSPGAPPLLVAPYDAELFGHWWYEGPWWVEQLLRAAAADPGPSLQMIHLGEYLRQHPTHQLCQPSQSSWGEGGFHEFWLNPASEWIYPHLHAAARRMVSLAADHPEARGVTRRALNQAARELLLAQASDWAFIMRTNTMVEYAVRRTRSHLRRFNHLHDQIRAGDVDRPMLERLEYMDSIFPEIDYTVYV